jgi:hypothetical protein
MQWNTRSVAFLAFHIMHLWRQEVDPFVRASSQVNETSGRVPVEFCCCASTPKS